MAARKRFAFEEIFIIQTAKALERADNDAQSAFVIDNTREHAEKFLSSLDVVPTGAQKRSITEILADFEKKQSMAVVSDYTDTIVIPIQILKIGINEELYEMYPELKDKRVGLGVANIVLEYLESTDRFKFTEDREEIKQKMIIKIYFLIMLEKLVQHF